MTQAESAGPPALLAVQFMVAAHRSELAPGTALGFSQLGEQIVLVNDGHIMRAFANVCRHRGASIVADGISEVSAEIVCPYHGWRYGLDGRLTATRGCARPTDDQLTPLASVELGGLVLVAIDAGHQPALEAAAAQLRPIFDAHGLGSASVCRRWSFRTATNWQLFVENFLECYHCHRAHRLLTRSEAFIDLLEQGRFGRLAEMTRATVAAARDAGWPIPAIDCDPAAAVFFQRMHQC